MFQISSIQIGHTNGLCITDERPNIRFALESDLPGESLRSATISCDNWVLETDDQLNNIYGGNFNPFTRYIIKIVAIGTSGRSAEIFAEFETGRLNTPWLGEWITDETYTFPLGQSPLPLVFKKEFNIKKPIIKAWCNTTALGIYELKINDRKVGTDYFAPGFTSYSSQIQYQTYDIKEFLLENNQITATVAGGWAAGAFTMKRKSHISCDRQAFLAEFHLSYCDGTEEIVTTDESWLVSRDSPYKLAEWYDGETYDASFDDKNSKWLNAAVTKPKGDPKLLAQYGPSVKIHKILQPIKKQPSASGSTIFDFGQNFSGIINCKINKAKDGQKIVIKHAEILFENELFTKPLRSAKATATYICIEGEQTYSPKFTYMGFRYIEVIGINEEDYEIEAMVLSSVLEEIGSFICSNKKLNQLNSNIHWSGLSNFVDIPTDCPQRDERMGWTGDAAVFASTACFQFDMSRFYDKWLRDFIAEQGKGGGFPMVIPQQGDDWKVMATSCWGDSCILVPWAEYLARGDIELLKRQYPIMKKFIKAATFWSNLLSVGHNRFIWELPFHFGDWCAPGGDFMFWISRAKWVATPYFSNSCNIMERIANLLGYENDAMNYYNLRERINTAFRTKLTDGKGKLKNEFQTAYTLPLFFGMTNGLETQNMAENLVKLINKSDFKIETGFPGTPYLLFALSDHGYVDEAYQVLLQSRHPGWLYAVNAGATTMWERWDALKPDGTINMGLNNENGGMVSFNHYANGAVGDWLYRRVAGIEAIYGGYKEFQIAPIPGGDITFAEAKVKSPFGIILSSWKIVNNRFDININVPVSTNCRLKLPSGEIHQLQSGIHNYSCFIS